MERVPRKQIDYVTGFVSFGLLRIRRYQCYYCYHQLRSIRIMGW